ncbi:sulfotransferase [Maricaulis sp.]|uniref:sulfotransferase family protein n=1 Tax=Maricaulis sp. TaxID=1486257 RepID=UPI0026291B7C|nr:sulfotransferase [Maricaulis sp.]MDF1769368.1 sulfotransferase [Maricaulis sp.]
MSTPLFVIGAPRSGTTFFTTSMNSHPQVFLTNELRAWNAIVLVSNRLANQSEVLPAHMLRDAYRDSVEQALVDNLRTFYRDNVNKTNLGCPTPGHQHYFRRIKVFGDKNPGYADANNANGLQTMDRLMPDAKFIHVHRDPRSCVASYLNIDVYPDDLGTAIDIWLRHARTAAEFIDTLDPDRVRTVRYETWVSENVEPVVEDLMSFLEVDDVPAVSKFLAQERVKRTPYRSPSTPQDKLGTTRYEETLSPDQVKHIETRCGDLMNRFGYL